MLSYDAAKAQKRTEARNFRYQGGKAAGLWHEGGEALEQVAQRSCGCHLSGSVQGQAGWSSEQPGLVEDVPAHGRGVGTR